MLTNYIKGQSHAMRKVEPTNVRVAIEWQLRGKAPEEDQGNLETLHGSEELGK